MLLEVSVAHERDLAGAHSGGADRLSFSQPTPDGAMSPDLKTASALLRQAELPVRVLLRLNDGFTTTGGEFTRLIGLAEEYLALGAEGLCFGFLNIALEVDEEVCTALAQALPGVRWTFHRGIDATLQPGRALRAALSLPGLDAIRTGGSPQGLTVGYEDLLQAATESPELARVLMPAGGLAAEQVAWFARAGVRQFHVGRQVRPTGSFAAYVDADLVRGWRLLLDGVARA